MRGTRDPVVWKTRGDLLAYIASRPQRIRVRRIKGFDMQVMSHALNGRRAIKCMRPGPWGNPFRVGSGYTAEDAVDDYRRWLKGLPYGPEFGQPPSEQKIRMCLSGYNLACGCVIGDPCHVDVLLEVANGGIETR